MLGRDPQTGELVVARMGPYGAYVQLGGMGGAPPVVAAAEEEGADEQEDEEAVDIVVQYHRNWVLPPHMVTTFLDWAARAS